MKQTKAIALCAMISALSVVIMLLGNLIGIGTYAAPMISGMLIICVDQKYGKKYHVSSWLTVSILSLILVSDIEEVVLFIFLFGAYPVIRSYLQRLPKILRIVTKLLYFNLVTVSLEALIMAILVPEPIDIIPVIILLILGNLIFLCFDFLIQHYNILYNKYLARLLRNF